MIIVQISDLHLRAGGKPLKGSIDSEATAAACMDHLEGLRPRPDLVLATGDLAQKGKRKDYRALRGMFDRLPMPVYVIPGNHDHRARMREAFADLGYLPEEGEFLHYTVEDFPLRLIGLDTLIPGRDGGELCAARLSWLEERLAEQPERPTVIFMHHPPFDTGVAYMDKWGFGGAAEAQRMVRRQRRVEWVVCGHMHRPVHVGWAGTVASTAPGIAFQMTLDLRRDAPSGLILEPPACPLFLWTPEGGMIGHLGPIGDFGPPRSFAD